MSTPPWETTRRPKWSVCPLDKYNVGEVAGPPAISPSKIMLAGAERPLFPPLDQALIQAMACEVVAQTKEPLSRQSLADLVRRGRATLGKKISRSTVWRMLHEAAIKPWQYEHWIFPRDPRFAEKAGPILDLYAGTWEGKPLGPKDYVLSMDEKTSIQARRRCHEEMPPEPRQRRRIEPEYERKGALQYLAAWDVHRGIVLGRCEAKTGIRPFGRLVDQVLGQEPYHDAERLFSVVDNGSSHRGQTSVERMRRRDKRIILVHTPVHASWLNQVEIYFSIIQRKVLTPNDFATLDAIRLRLELYEQLSNRTARPFAWKFTRQDLLNWLKRASPHFLAASAA
jgi:DDE superfamily endonuclease